MALIDPSRQVIKSSNTMSFFRFEFPVKWMKVTNLNRSLLFLVANRYPPPSPLNLRTGSEGASPSTSPLWTASTSSIAASPSGWATSNRGPPASAPGVQSAKVDVDLNNQANPLVANNHHFRFSHNHISGAVVPPPPPRPPPHRPPSTAGATGIHWEASSQH